MISYQNQVLNVIKITFHQNENRTLRGRRRTKTKRTQERRTRTEIERIETFAQK
jgi:hypothetical protein